MKVSVKIVNKSHHALPSYSTLFSAGMDIRANLSEPVTLAPMERRLIPTGLFIALPEGYEAQIRPRSGLALKHGITIPNSPGTIDADYRGHSIRWDTSQAFITSPCDRCRLSGRGRYHRVERFGQAVYHRRRRAYLPNGGERVLSGRVE